MLLWRQAQPLRRVLQQCPPPYSIRSQSIDSSHLSCQSNEGGCILTGWDGFLQVPASSSSLYSACTAVPSSPGSAEQLAGQCCSVTLARLQLAARLNLLTSTISPTLQDIVCLHSVPMTCSDIWVLLSSSDSNGSSLPDLCSLYRLLCTESRQSSLPAVDKRLCCRGGIGSMALCAPWMPRAASSCTWRPRKACSTPFAMTASPSGTTAWWSVSSL